MSPRPPRPQRWPGRLLLAAAALGCLAQPPGCVPAATRPLPARLGRVAVLGLELDPRLQIPEAFVPQAVAWFAPAVASYLRQGLAGSQRVELVEVAPDVAAAAMADALRELGVTDFVNPRSGNFDHAGYARFLQRVAAKLAVDGVVGLRLVAATAPENAANVAGWDGTTQSTIPGVGTEERDDFSFGGGTGAADSLFAAASLAAMLVTATAGEVWQGQGGWHLLEQGTARERIAPAVLFARNGSRRDACVARALNPLISLVK